MSENNGNGRDPTNGRMQPGNRLSVGNRGGNPVAKRMNELRSMVVEAEAPENVLAAFRKLRDVAMTGDVAGLKLYLEYVCGRPPQTLEVSTPEGKGVDLTMVAAIVMEAVGDDQNIRQRIAARFAQLGRPADGMGG
jgi:hypothetical protein